MTDLAYRALRCRLINEFADDPGTVADILKAEGVAPIAATLAHGYTSYMELLRTFGGSEGNVGRDVRQKITDAAERRETALLDLMRFFELREVRGRDVVVRRTDETGLSVRYRAADRAAGNA